VTPVEPPPRHAGAHEPAPRQQRTRLRWLIREPGDRQLVLAPAGRQLGIRPARHGRALGARRRRQVGARLGDRRIELGEQR